MAKPDLIYEENFNLQMTASMKQELKAFHLFWETNSMAFVARRFLRDGIERAKFKLEPHERESFDRIYNNVVEADKVKDVMKEPDEYLGE